MAFQKAVKGSILVGGGALATVLGLSQFAHYRRKQVSNCICINYNIKLKSMRHLYVDAFCFEIVVLQSEIQVQNIAKVILESYAFCCFEITLSESIILFSLYFGTSVFKDYFIWKCQDLFIQASLI